MYKINTILRWNSNFDVYEIVTKIDNEYIGTVNAYGSYIEESIDTPIYYFAFITDIFVD